MNATLMHKNPTPADFLGQLLGPLSGGQVAGGCDECDARQVVRQVEAGGWTITTHHADGCPWYEARGGGAQS